MKLDEDPLTMKITPIELETMALNSQAVSPFCVSWSKDHKVSVIVDGGVFIFELWASPNCESQSLMFVKNWIPASSMMPLANLVSDKSNFLWGLNRNEAFEVALDSTLSNVIEKANPAINTSHIIQCEFSPSINNQSYIACLTNNGLLEIFKYEYNKWLSILNLSQLWINHSKTEIYQNDYDFSYFKTKMMELKITSMQWLAQPKVIFLTSHKNGMICFWNVDTSKETLCMSVMYCIQSNLNPCILYVTFLSNFSLPLLFIGCASGIVKSFYFDLKTGHVNCQIHIWEQEDLIPANDFKLDYSGTNHFCVFIVKRHILLISKLSVYSSKIELLKINWLDFPSSINGLNKWKDNFIFVLQNHNIYSIKVNHHDLSYDLELLDANVKMKNNKYSNCYGLAMSTNKAIWVFVSSSNTNYESHKKQTNLLFYTTKVKIFKSLCDTISSNLIENIFEKYTGTKLCEISDLLELKRLELLSDESKFKSSYKVYENMSVNQVQLMLWEAKLKQLCHLTDSNSEIINLEFFISKKQANEVVDKLKKKGTLTESEGQALIINSALSVKTDLKKISVSESCLICGAKSNFDNIKISSCPNAHKFPRCCLSLLPCCEVPYLACQLCDRVAMARFVSEINSHCPFCDCLMRMSTRLT